jgi:hypothetical protein
LRLLNAKTKTDSTTTAIGAKMTMFFFIYVHDA